MDATTLESEMFKGEQAIKLWRAAYKDSTVRGIHELVRRLATVCGWAIEVAEQAVSTG